MSVSRVGRSTRCVARQGKDRCCGYSFGKRQRVAICGLRRQKYAADYPNAELVPELELTLENLSDVLDQYGIKFKKIVMAQALLETGNFTSNICQTIHNIFGLRRPSDGSYFEFPNWMDCVRTYRDAVQYKYVSGDYYDFLDRIGYAEDKAYTSKVRRIAKRL